MSFSELYSNRLSEGATGVVRVTWQLNHNTQFYRVLGIGKASASHFNVAFFWLICHLKGRC